MNAKIRLFANLVASFGLLVLPSIIAAQNSFSPFKVTIFQDAGQVGAKGIIQFDQLTATVNMPYAVEAEQSYLVAGNSETKLSYFKLHADSVAQKVAVQNIPELIKANPGKSMTLVFEAGLETDEISGQAKIISDLEGLVSVQTSSENTFILPLKQIKQVILQGAGNTKLEKKVLQNRMVIGLQQEAPFVPFELYSMHGNIRWTTLCRIRIMGADKAELQLGALIRNDFADLGEVNVQLSTSNIKMQGEQNGDIIDAGKINLRKGEQVAINLRNESLEYSPAYQCRIPWAGSPYTNGQINRFNVDNLLRFNMPSLPGFACEYYAVIDEENRQLANVQLDENQGNGPFELKLGQEKMIHASLQETEIKRGGKPVKVGEMEFERISIEGKIICYNLGEKFIQLQLQREVKGDVVEAEKAKTEDNLDEGTKSIIWRVSLDKGQKKEVSYKYDTFVPIKGK